MKTVTHARVGTGSTTAREIRYRYWDLMLECGHRTERPCRYTKQTGPVRRGWAAIWHLRPIYEMLPAPKRVRCDECED